MTFLPPPGASESWIGVAPGREVANSRSARESTTHAVPPKESEVPELRQ